MRQNICKTKEFMEVTKMDFESIEQEKIKEEFGETLEDRNKYAEFDTDYDDNRTYESVMNDW